MWKPLSSAVTRPLRVTSLFKGATTRQRESSTSKILRGCEALQRLRDRHPRAAREKELLGPSPVLHVAAAFPTIAGLLLA